MINQLATVLIGTSFTEASDPVVRSGVLLARRTGAKIHMAHACQPPLSYGGAPFFPEFAVNEVLEAERAALQRQLDVQMSRLELDRAELAGVHLEVGPAHRFLVETSEKIGADLIVVGSSESPLLAKVFGSTADRVLRKATCPVLVVRAELRLPLQRVLLPVDLSPLSAEAFENGLRLLASIDGAAAPVVETLYVMNERDRQALSARATETLVEQLALQELKRFVAQHAAGVPWKIETLVKSGSVEVGILDRIDTWEPDLVLLGTHGRDGFERILLGSVSSTVLRQSTSSVLVIPPRTSRKERSEVEKAREAHSLPAAAG